MELWPHQESGLAEVERLVAAGHRQIVVTSPCGGGKTVMMATLIERLACPTILYTNRKMLREQTSEVMERFGIRHGVRAAGAEPALLRDVQVSSIMTEQSRVYKKGKWKLHEAQLVLVDEVHNQKGGIAQKILSQHLADGAICLGFTATPLDLDQFWQDLVVAGTNSELRDCGAHVICRTFAPDQPDEQKLKLVKVGEDLTDAENVKAIMRPGIEGRVYENWKTLNPDGKPTILFGPDVAGSLWFAEKLHEKYGLSTAHIDGERIWINGEMHSSNQEMRDELANLSRAGDLHIVCNRFVMREGIDWPWLAHCIMATVFGSLTSYLQSGGRFLRAYPGLDEVCLQDHGGNFHRHGSLNEDRDWFLGLTNSIAVGLRRERLRDRKLTEPITCPKCKLVRSGGQRCPRCGEEATKRSRVVVQHDGTLIQVDGDQYRPRRTRESPNTKELWEKMYYRARKSRNAMTFSQAYGLFYHESKYFPPKDLPFMPQHDLDWHRRVKDVHPSDLIGGNK
jgi:superfamily II DNA or RNA helicase